MITIVIPVNNRADIVGRTLDSIESQTLRPLSIVLVDNASTDNTLEVITRWKDRVQATDFSVEIVSCPSPGPCAARNEGLKHVKTPWTMFFDSDDIMHPHHLQRVADAIKQHPDVDIFGWDVTLCGPDGHKTGIGRFATSDAIFNNIFHGSFSTQRYVAKTEAFRAAGLWNESLRAWVDIELGVRLLSNNPNIIKLKGADYVKVISSTQSVTSSAIADGGKRFVASAETIRKQLPESKSDLISLKEAILAANLHRLGNEESARNLLESAISSTSALRKPLIRFAYSYTACGLRAIARILRPLL